MEIPVRHVTEEEIIKKLYERKAKEPVKEELPEEKTLEFNADWKIWAFWVSLLFIIALLVWSYMRHTAGEDEYTQPEEYHRLGHRFTSQVRVEYQQLPEDPVGKI